MKAPRSASLPKHFCWTRFGTEAGQEVSSILARKERERLATGGLFLWGIGNSVGPAMRHLVRLESVPLAVFSPMRSKPKAIDVAPSRVVRWTRALDMDGHDWSIPEAVTVLSRGSSVELGDKRYHYALVCRSGQPLQGLEIGRVAYNRLVNLLSGARLGASQVTAVVEHLKNVGDAQSVYPIAFTAELAFPYFVKLEDPVELQGEGIRLAGTLRRGRKGGFLAN